MKILPFVRGGFTLLAVWLSGIFSPAIGAPPAAAPQTYVIVHGAWGGGWAFREVDRLLTAMGHKVYRPTLTGLGERVHLAHPGIDLTTHITDIVNVILYEDLHDVVLVGHSYGGIVITGVMDRIPERIRHVIFLDASVPDDGESQVSLGRKITPENIASGFLPPWPGAAEKPIPHDVPHPIKTLTESVSYKNPAAKQLSATYVLFLEKGKVLEQHPRYASWQKAKARGWMMRILESDHNAQWSHPKELAELLNEAPQASAPPTPPTSSTAPAK